jgi:NAD(P)-dependent dehydrogenase (short-subunit alcohol dehydrogenase family)
MGQLTGKVCLVTGAASGIGQQMAIELAKQGATVVVSARDVERARGAAEAVLAAVGPGAKVDSLACDLASVASIRAAAAQFSARYGELHLLVNNAAVYSGKRRLSADGYELGFAVNNLAPFLLTNLLLGELRAAAPSRVVMMTMPTKTPIDFEDPQSEKSYKPLKALQMTKGCEQYTTVELARRLEGTGVSVVAVSPGLTQSKLPSEAPLPLRIVFKLFGKAPVDGARVPLSACLDAKWESGVFVSDKGGVESYPAFIDHASTQRLWDLNARLCGL